MENKIENKVKEILPSLNGLTFKEVEDVLYELKKEVQKSRVHITNDSL